MIKLWRICLFLRALATIVHFFFAPLQTLWTRATFITKLPPKKSIRTGKLCVFLLDWIKYIVCDQLVPNLFMLCALTTIVHFFLPHYRPCGHVQHSLLNFCQKKPIRSGKLCVFRCLYLNILFMIKLCGICLFLCARTTIMYFVVDVVAPLQNFWVCATEWCGETCGEAVPLSYLNDSQITGSVTQNDCG